MDDAVTAFGVLSAPIQRALLLVVAGHGNAAIADQMGLTPRSVRIMLAEAAFAMGVTSRAELINRVRQAHRSVSGGAPYPGPLDEPRR
jgi:DNA-binding CsgD family transcriptional regulator